MSWLRIQNGDLLFAGLSSSILVSLKHCETNCAEVL